MRRVDSRPFGITLVAAVVALNGLGSLIEAFRVAEFTVGGALGSVLSAIIGLALLHRAYGIWTQRYSAWLITVALLSIRTVLAVAVLILTGLDIPEWINLVVVVVTLLYMLHPSTRDLFPRDRSPI